MLFTFPSRYWFAIGHGRVFSLGGWSPLLRTGFHVPGPTRGSGSGGGDGFAYGALTRYGRPSHAVPLPSPFLTAAVARGPRTTRPATPTRQRPRALTLASVWAGALSLAATRAISVDFSSSGYLDVSVPPVASPRPMYSSAGSRALPLLGSPIRRSPDRGLSAPPRGLSQLAASFFGFPCQGIRRAPVTSSLNPLTESSVVPIDDIYGCIAYLASRSQMR